MDRKGIITMKGNPLTLSGSPVRAGDKAPDFVVLDKDMKEKSLKDYAGKVKLISVTPSLDTPVCDIQIHAFEREATGMSDEAVVLNISADLPFAIKRFCSAGGIERVEALSDHRDLSFGNAYGEVIKELRLLARSVFVIDKNDAVRYVEQLSEVTDEPDYDAALKALKSAL
ncbi:MAG: thiol peroxidase [Synergistaceae bacterium]|nr:thiol peroxidase [Synergistaceae bacterium]